MYVITKDLGRVIRIVDSLVANNADEIEKVVVFFRRSHGDYKRPSHR